MPKLLRFILNGFAAITALGFLSIVLPIPLYLLMGWETKMIVLWLLTLIPIALHRLSIMLGELCFIRPYLNGQHVIKELCKINMYVVFSLFLSSILCTAIFLRKLYVILQVKYWESLTTWHYILWGSIALIMSLVAIAEMYIKTDYIKEKHLTTNPKKVTQLLSAIIIPIYILWVAGLLAFYLYIMASRIVVIPS